MLLQESDLCAPDAVIFDWDSTLVDNWGAIHIALNVTLKQMGHKTWTECETRQRANSSAKDAFPRLFAEHSDEALQIFYQAFDRFHLDSLKVLEGSKDLIEWFLKNNVYLSIVSNKNGIHLRKEVSKLGWSNCFQSIVGAGDATEDKPSPEPVKLALKNAGLDAKSKVWFVGDTGLDLQCAVLSNCVPILIGGQNVEKSDLEMWPPHSVFQSCEKLYQACRNIS
ncbi:HAD family hydrolase [Rhodospirillaceae bacterium]|jgi:phosphoglycolate phosphatase|nr:HAD family hydrolase [Rhodospirillaceae bacterium]MBT6305134.1 HAD family hydrolase [Rhodospirillaceae bacterium]MDC1441552.1 HAD family hydrolase [Rhodospirillaceae bacterium]